MMIPQLSFHIKDFCKLTNLRKKDAEAMERKNDNKAVINMPGFHIFHFFKSTNLRKKDAEVFKKLQK